MRCLMCEEPTMLFIPSDDVDGVGLYSCEVCDFEIEAPREPPVRLLPAPMHWATHAPAAAPVVAAAGSLPATTTTTAVAKTLQPL